MAAKAKPIEDEEDDLPGDPEPKTVPKKKPAPAPVAVEEDEPEEKPPAPKKHVHNSRLVDLAIHFGYSQAEMDNTPSDTLRQEIQLLQSTVASQRPAPEPKKPDVEPVDEDEAYLAELEANPEVDPKHAKFLKRQVVARKAAEAKAAKIDQIEQVQISRTQRDNTDMVERAMAALPKRFQKIIGTDAYADMPEGAEKQRKFAIFQMAKIDFTKDSARTIDKKIATAAATLYAGEEELEEEPDTTTSSFDTPPKKKAPPKDPESGRFTAEDFERGHVAKPRKTVGAAPILNGPQAVRRWKNETGFSGDADDGESNDLPGE